MGKLWQVARVTETPMHALTEFPLVNLQLQCQADLCEHGFVTFGVCVPNGEICAMCKHAILFQTWQNV
jgi:hypothetical protein